MSVQDSIQEEMERTLEKESSREKYELSTLLDMEKEDLVELAEELGISTVGSLRDIARRVMRVQASLDEEVIDLGRVNLKITEREGNDSE